MGKIWQDTVHKERKFMESVVKEFGEKVLEVEKKI